MTLTSSDVWAVRHSLAAAPKMTAGQLARAADLLERWTPQPDPTA
jgi:hypothetical protein